MKRFAKQSSQVSWDAQTSEFKDAIETLSNVEEVEVTKDQWTDETGFDFYRWTVCKYYVCCGAAVLWIIRQRFRRVVLNINITNGGTMMVMSR